MAFKKTSKQNLSHYTATTFDFGKLIPVQALEAVQGDTFKLQTQAFLRLAPMVFPVIQPIWVRIHHWFVPYRTLWCGYEDFITGKELTRVLPFIFTNEQKTHDKNSLLCRMGILPANYPKAKPFPILPLLAYWKIWKEFYADEQLDENQIGKVERLLDIMTNRTDEKILAGGDIDFSNDYGSFGFNYSNPASVAWHKDYFTGARVSPIIGPEITIGVNPPVSGNTSLKVGVFNLDNVKPSDGMVIGQEPSISTTGRLGIKWNSISSPGTDILSNQWNFNNGALSIPAESVNNLFQNASVNLSELMAGFALQRLFQKQNEYGNRYQEWLANQGVRYSDKSLQLPQYIGGGKDLFDINEVIQTSSSAGSSPLGEFAGRGTSSVSTRVCYHYCEEPGIVLSLASIVPKNMYEIQGIRKNWNRRTFEETYQPELEHLDMQPIKNSELFIQHNDEDKETFGYTPRYDELRTQESFVSGDLIASERYSEFTMARSFSEKPTLNSSFIACQPDKRIFYDNASESVIGVFKNKTIARRHLIKRSHIKLV